MGLKKYLLNRKDEGNDRWLLFKPSFRNSIIQGLISAGIDFALMAEYADEDENPGTNTPFTNPFVDVINGNDIDLQNFDETVTDGWVELTAQSGNDKPYLMWDGINSIGFGADDIDAINVQGLDEFIIYTNIITGDTIPTSWLFNRGLKDVSIQFAVRMAASSFTLYIGNQPYGLTSAPQSNTNYTLMIKRENGRLICKFDSEKVYDIANIKDAGVETPHFRVGCRANNDTGTIHKEYFNGAISHLFIGLNPDFEKSEIAISKAMDGYRKTTILNDGVLRPNDTWDDTATMYFY